MQMHYKLELCKTSCMTLRIEQVTGSFNDTFSTRTILQRQINPQHKKRRGVFPLCNCACIVLHLIKHSKPLFAKETHN